MKYGARVNQTSHKATISNIFNAQGFTILEVMVALTIGSIAMMSVLSFSILQKDLFTSQIQRVGIQQNITSSVNLVGDYIRQAGENLSSEIGAIELINDNGQKSLTLRRGLIPEIATLCSPVFANSRRIYISEPSSNIGACQNKNAKYIRNIFKAERKKDELKKVDIYIYDRSTKIGEFLEYNREGFNRITSTHFLVTSRLKNSYTPFFTNIYYLEEASFHLNEQGSYLEVVKNQKIDSPQKVVFNIDIFNIDISLNDNSTTQSLVIGPGYDWKKIKSINLNVEGRDLYKGKEVREKLTASFLPRNVLSK